MPHAMTERSAATLPYDSVSATDSEGDDADEQEEAGTKKRTDD